MNIVSQHSVLLLEQPVLSGLPPQTGPQPEFSKRAAFSTGTHYFKLIGASCWSGIGVWQGGEMTASAIGYEPARENVNIIQKAPLIGTPG